MKEIWKDIKGYEGMYMVSNFGRVKSISRLMKYSNGLICRHKERELKQETINIRYKRVSLSKNNVTKRFQVHRLVAIEFIPNPENKPCVNHIDGNPSNNFKSNLEWATYSENELHSYNSLGKINKNRKLNSQDIEFIKNNHVLRNGNDMGNTKYLAEKFNVHTTTILNIVNDKYYKK